VEWCKAYSRANRWREELVLLEEEMRQTIEFGRHAEHQWTSQALARTAMLGDSSLEVDAAVMEGARAYALEQADRERRTCTKLEADWGPLRVKASMYLRGEDSAGGPEIVVEVEEEEVRWAEARAYTEEETENDMYQ
jgi:hypothetical protein